MVSPQPRRPRRAAAIAGCHRLLVKRPVAWSSRRVTMFKRGQVSAARSVSEPTASDRGKMRRVGRPAAKPHHGRAKPTHPLPLAS